MNERIRELAKQAGGEFWQRLENDVVNPEAYITFDPPGSLEKFAELIVQRTLDIVEAHTEIFQSDEARAIVEHIKQSVKTDFGVGG
jgi:hypothetical protein